MGEKIRMSINRIIFQTVMGVLVTGTAVFAGKTIVDYNHTKYKVKEELYDKVSLDEMKKIEEKCEKIGSINQKTKRWENALKEYNQAETMKAEIQKAYQKGAQMVRDSIKNANASKIAVEQLSKIK